MKIHCSLACKELLDRLGGYVLEERGEIKIKGKGDMVTYWLVGETAANTDRGRNRAPTKCAFNPKSSMRTSKRCTDDFDSLFNLDSPKKLRFALDPAAGGCGDADADGGDQSNGKPLCRSSCPNLEAALRSGHVPPASLTGSMDDRRKLSAASHRLSTTSLVDAAGYGHPRRSSSSNSNSTAHKYSPPPKIELSPPEDGKHDHWPLLQSRFADENESCV